MCIEILVEDLTPKCHPENTVKKKNTQRKLKTFVNDDETRNFHKEKLS